jgi:ankyrin repeat protein
MDQFEAAEHDNLQVLRGFLNTNNVDNADSFGWTTIHHAAGKGKVECVRYCLEMGANVMPRTFNGWTPLHVASLNGHMDVARLSLDAGTPVDIADNVGWTPLRCAIQGSYRTIARLLIDRGARASNVLLDNRVSKIPDWVTTIVESRSNCRCAAMVIVGLHKYRRTTVTGNNDINVLRLIGKHIWSTRMDELWVERKVV